MTYNPKEVMDFLWSPDEELFHLTLTLKDYPGSFADIATLLREQLSILSGFTSAEIEKDTGTWSLFAKALHRGLTVEELRKIVSSSPFLLASNITKSEGGLIVDSHNFPLTSSGGKARSLLVSTKAFSGMLKQIRQKFGTGGEVIVYDQGFRFGEIFGQILATTFGSERALNRKAELINLYSAFGWARAEVIQHDATVIWVFMRDSFECSGERSDKPYSYFVRGHLEGILSELLGYRVSCRETRCVAMGHDKCEFLISLSRDSAVEIGAKDAWSPGQSRNPHHLSHEV